MSKNNHSIYRFALLTGLNVMAFKLIDKVFGISAGVLLKTGFFTANYMYNVETTVGGIFMRPDAENVVKFRIDALTDYIQWPFESQAPWTVDFVDLNFALLAGTSVAVSAII